MLPTLVKSDPAPLPGIDVERTVRPSILAVPFTYIYVQKTPDPCDLHTSIITCPSRPHLAFQLVQYDALEFQESIWQWSTVQPACPSRKSTACAVTCTCSPVDSAQHWVPVDQTDWHAETAKSLFASY